MKLVRLKGFVIYDSLLLVFGTLTAFFPVLYSKRLQIDVIEMQRSSREDELQANRSHNDDNESYFSTKNTDSELERANR